MCKVFGKKPTDDFFQEMSNLEMAWMAAMISQDEKEEMEKEIDFADYSASYVNPQGVEKVRESRKQTKSVSDDDFQKSLDRLRSGKIGKIKLDG